MAVMRRRAGRRTPAGFVSLRNPNKVIFLQIRMRIVVDVSNEASRWRSCAFALIKYAPLAVKSWRFHSFRAGSTEEVASEAGHLCTRIVVVLHMIDARSKLPF
jgi:hypothetical protein